MPTVQPFNEWDAGITFPELLRALADDIESGNTRGDLAVRVVRWREDLPVTYEIALETTSSHVDLHGATKAQWLALCQTWKLVLVQAEKYTW